VGLASKRDMKTFSQLHFKARFRARMAALPALIAAVLVVGCASEPVDERLVKEQDKPAAKPSSCVQQGATRLPQKSECASTPGRSHSKEELDRTGGATLEEKLRVLDPAVSGPR
jgi:hypothetical protein